MAVGKTDPACKDPDCSYRADLAIQGDVAEVYRLENQRLRNALLTAADDLDKAANQFAGFAHMDAPTIRRFIHNNPGIFAAKAARAREASGADPFAPMVSYPDDEMGG